MRLFHLDKAKYQHVWPPEGTLHAEGRWNKKGQWIIYTSPVVSLAKLEVLANEGMLPLKRVCMTIEVADEASVFTLSHDLLPEDWHKKPYPPRLAVLMKEYLLDADRLVLGVPSAQSYGEYNYLLNVRHRDFFRLVSLHEVTPEPFDSRLK